LTEEELDELERRQEEYLLQIRKIKVATIPLPYNILLMLSSPRYAAYIKEVVGCVHKKESINTAGLGIYHRYAWFLFYPSGKMMAKS